MIQWHLIDSAPQDGTLIILWDAGCHIGSWRRYYTLTGHEYPMKWWASSDGTAKHAVSVDPTHWMPLPEPPK